MCQEMSGSQTKGSQSAPRSMLVRSWTLKKQLLQYVWKPLSREAWNLDISLSSLCTEPWGDSWLKIVSLFAVVLWQCEHKPNQNQMIKGSCLATTKARVPDTCSNSFQVDTSDLEQRLHAHGDDTG